VRSHEGAAKPYARALFSLAQERGQVDAVSGELDRAVDLLSDAALRDFFARPWVAVSAKRNAATEIATRANLSPLMRDFVTLVVAQGRAEALPAIGTVYRDLADAEAGRVRAQVRTAVPLTDTERAALAARLRRTLERERGTPVSVVVDEVVDRKLLGGFVAEVGSLVIDGSLDGQLARLKARLARG